MFYTLTKEDNGGVGEKLPDWADNYLKEEIKMATIRSQKNQKFCLVFRVIALFVILTFSTSFIIMPSKACAQSMLNLPSPGVMVPLSAGIAPAVMVGIKLFPDNPFRFNFIIDTGNFEGDNESLKEESTKLIKYFLASLTIPEEDLWVNLSPYEEDRIIPEEFGLTEMGRDLLAQDYVLKQLMASLSFPDSGLGRQFWERVFKKAYDMYGDTTIPINTFNKVWILPETAEVYEEGNTAYVVKSRLKVMLEEDYLAIRKNFDNQEIGTAKEQEEEVKAISNVSSGIVREVLIPEIEKEVNEGKNFMLLRQVYQSLILATWYKQRLKVGTGRDLSLLGQIYVDKGKIKGVEVEDKEIKNKIYEQYIEAFKDGVYDMIREDYDEYMERVIPRRYFSGGFGLNQIEEVFTLRDKITETERQEAIGVVNNSVSIDVALLTNNEFANRAVLSTGMAAALLAPAIGAEAADTGESEETKLEDSIIEDYSYELNNVSST